MQFKVPIIGFGTWKLKEGEETLSSVSAALDTGYRLIDTAKIYGNESSVGQAINKSAVKRKDIVVTTKLWNSDHNKVEDAFNDSLSRLGLDYIDLYLIHWPGPDNNKTWQQLLKLKKSGKVREVGVSNFDTNQIKEITNSTGQAPAVNQIELHPFIYDKQKDTVDYCNANGIIVEAYSPLSRANKLNNEIINKIADKYNKLPAQIMLRWSIQHNAVPIPKSSNPDHIKSNYMISDFKLSEEDMDVLNNLGAGKSALPF